MRTLCLTTLGLALALLTAGCDVTGTAPPQSAYVHQGGLNYIGEPGSGAP
jgi:hypothetical protein